MLWGVGNDGTCVLQCIGYYSFWNHCNYDFWLDHYTEQ